MITDTDNIFEEKKVKIGEINSELNKYSYLFTNLTTNNKIEEEIQEETIENSNHEKQIQKEKILYLEIITSSYITKGTIIKLTPEGYDKSPRKIKDGITYFGYEESDKNNINEVS